MVFSILSTSMYLDLPSRIYTPSFYPIRSVAANSSAILKVTCNTSPSTSNQIVENPRTSSPNVNLCPILPGCVISSWQVRKWLTPHVCQELDPAFRRPHRNIHFDNLAEELELQHYQLSILSPLRSNIKFSRHILASMQR